MILFGFGWLGLYSCAWWFLVYVWLFAVICLLVALWFVFVFRFVSAILGLFALRCWFGGYVFCVLMCGVVVLDMLLPRWVC